jgi:hypothetical protein
MTWKENTELILSVTTIQILSSDASQNCKYLLLTVTMLIRRSQWWNPRLRRPLSTHLKGLKGLTILDIWPQDAGPFPPALATNLVNLKELRLEAASITSLPSLVRMTQLKVLDVSGNEATLKGPLPALPMSLQQCSVSSTQCRTAGVRYPSACSSVPQCGPCFKNKGGCDANAVCSSSGTTVRCACPTGWFNGPGTSSKTCWKCIRSCAAVDRKRYTLVRDDGSTISCASNDGKACSWFSDASCKRVAVGSRAPVATRVVRCRSLTGRTWCAEASKQLRGKLPQTKC